VRWTVVCPAMASGVVAGVADLAEDEHGDCQSVVQHEGEVGGAFAHGGTMVPMVVARRAHRPWPIRLRASGQLGRVKPLDSAASRTTGRCYVSGRAAHPYPTTRPGPWRPT
jgi:hypothetical protein